MSNAVPCLPHEYFDLSSFSLLIKSKWLSMFAAYFDDSGDPSSTQVLSVGGILSRVKDWELFDEKWSKRLRRNRVSIMHMKHYEHGIKDFAGWDKDKRIAFMQDLCAILKNSSKCGVAATVKMEDWLSVMPGNFERPDFVSRQGAYQFLFQL